MGSARSPRRTGCGGAAGRARQEAGCSTAPPDRRTRGAPAPPGTGVSRSASGVQPLGPLQLREPPIGGLALQPLVEREDDPVDQGLLHQRRPSTGSASGAGVPAVARRARPGASAPPGRDPRSRPRNGAGAWLRGPRDPSCVPGPPGSPGRASGRRCAGTRVPRCSPVTISALPPTRVLTTGRPQARDSSSTLAQPSERVARQKRSAAASQRGISSCGALARQEDVAVEPRPRDHALEDRTVGVAGLPAAHDHVEEVGMAVEKRRKHSDDPVMALALVEPSDGEDDGPVDRELEGSARRGLAHREEARGVDAVGNDADLLARHPQPDRGALERVADRDDPVRRPQGPAELGTMGGITGSRTMLPRSVTITGHRKILAEQDARYPVGIVELRVDDVERKAPPQPEEKGHAATPRRAARRDIWDIAGCRRPGGGGPAARPARPPRRGCRSTALRGSAIEREPWHGRDHFDVTTASYPAHALANEDAERRLLWVREHRAEHQDAEAHRRHRGWGVRGPDGSSP